MNDKSESEVLVVVSKLKNFIRAEAGMNTSGNVPEAISEIIRDLCKQAIENAQSDGRKTVMDRDFGSVGGSVAASCDSGVTSCESAAVGAEL